MPARGQPFAYMAGSDKGDESRDWPRAANLDGTGRSKGTDALGHALEAAVMGRPYGDPSGGLHRGADEIAVMHKVMDLYGDPEHSPREQQPGIGDSLGRMGAAYIDDINYGLQDETGLAGKKNSAELIGYGKEYDGHGITSLQAKHFMRELGQDEEAYKIMSAAQEAFTVSRLHQIDGAADSFEVAKMGVVGHGALDQARVDQIGLEYEKDEAAHNKALEDAARWKKGIASVGVYAAVGAAGAALTPAEGAAAIVIPAATGGGGVGAVSGINAAIDKALGADTFDNSGQAISDITEFSEQGQRNAINTAIKYLDEYAGEDNDWRAGDTNLKNSYREGKAMTETPGSVVP